VTWGAATDESAYAKLPPLREYPPCMKFLAEVKDRFISTPCRFFRGRVGGLSWPTVHFKSALNANYLARRAAAMKIAQPPKPKKGGDAIDAILDAPSTSPDSIPRESLLPGSGSATYPATLRPEDLPCQRNLLKEFCERRTPRPRRVHDLPAEDMGKLYTGQRTRTRMKYSSRRVRPAVWTACRWSRRGAPLWSCSGTPRWRQFDHQTRDRRKDFTPIETNRWIQQRSEVSALCMTERKENVLKVKPDCKFIVDGARLLGGGDPYDVIWHRVDPDYVGCSYQSHLVPRWAATSKNRRVAMGEYTHRSVRYNLESLLLGARMIRSYRYNYIMETTHSEDHRRRENLFIDQCMRWGGTGRRVRRPRCWSRGPPRRGGRPTARRAW